MSWNGDRDIMILPADKGKATVLMNSSDYKQKLSNLLDDKTVYEVLKKYVATTYKNRLVKIPRELKTEGTISGSVCHEIYTTSKDAPNFYGLPKIHKKDSPLRPIVSRIGSISFKAAMHLAVILNPLTGKNSFTIKNSEDIVNKIKDLGTTT